MEFTGITSVLPLKSAVLPVLIPPNFTTDFHWYTTGNTTGKPLVIPETFSRGGGGIFDTFLISSSRELKIA